MNLINYAQLSLTELQLAHTASYCQGTHMVHDIPIPFLNNKLQRTCLKAVKSHQASI